MERLFRRVSNIASFLLHIGSVSKSRAAAEADEISRRKRNQECAIRNVLASRNGGYTRSPHALRVRDPQPAGETAEVTVGSAGEVNPQSLDVEVETRSLVGDGRTIQDR